MAAAKIEELHKLTQEGDEADLNRVIAIADGLLKTDAKDADMISCKIVATVMKEEYKKAVGMILKDPALAKAHAFELLYCYYQMKDHAAALALVKDTPARGKNKGFWHVEAQLLRRLGRTKEAADIYEKQFISKKGRMSNDDNAGEIRANYVACLSGTNPGKAITYTDKLAKDEWAHGVAFNVASSLADSGKAERAVEVVDMAEKLCKEELKDEDEKEIAQELENISLVKGYVLQKTDKGSDAEAIYRALLGSSQPAVAAQARIGLVSLDHCKSNTKAGGKEGGGVSGACLDWAKAAASAPEGKLSEEQTRAASVNLCLSTLKGKRGKEQASAYSHLRKMIKDSPLPAIAYASLLITDGPKDGFQRAEEVLRTYLSEGSPSKEAEVEVRVALATMFMSKRKAKEAVAELQALGEEYLTQPAVVGTIVRLLRKQGRIQEAAKCLDDAIAFWQQQGDKGIVASLKAAGADLKAKLGEHKEAAESFEAMAKATGEVKYLCGVVSSASHFDMELAEKYAKKLPAFDEEGLDAEAVEGLPNFDSKDAKKKKKKSKRKPRLPKEYDPNEPPDPERWLPKWERSYNKRSRGKRRNRNQMRGPQGGAVRADLAASLDKSAKPDSKEEKGLPPKPSASSGRKQKGRRKKRR